MNDSIILSFKRLFNLIKNEVNLQIKAMSLVAAIIFFLTMLLFNFDRETFFYILYIGGFLFTSSCFNDLHNPNKGHLFLMLPCSNLERFLAKWFMTFVGYTVYLFVIFSFYSAFRAALSFFMFGHRVAMFNLFSPELWQGIGNYMIFQSVFLLGAISFKNKAFLKTSLTVGCLLTGITVFSIVISLSLLFPNYENVNDMLEVMNNAAYYAFLFLLAPLCWYITYLKLTEYELK